MPRPGSGSGGRAGGPDRRGRRATEPRGTAGGRPAGGRARPTEPGGATARRSGGPPDPRGATGGRRAGGSSDPRGGAGGPQRRGRPGQQGGADDWRSGRPFDQRPRQTGEERGLGGDQVEGRQAVAELLDAGRRRVRDVWLADDLDPAPVIDEILSSAERLRVPVRQAARARLEAMARTEAPQGVLAHAEPLPEAEFDDLCQPGDVPPFLLALDGVTDPQNLGALLRTAEAAGVTGVVLPKHRAVHVTPAVTKAAAGAIEHLPMALVGGLPNALSRAKDLGVWVVGLVPDADESIFDVSVGDGPVMAVLGAEGPGLSRLVQARCDVLAGIPLHGSLPSLNVSAAGAVALFELARQRSHPQG